MVALLFEVEKPDVTLKMDWIFNEGLSFAGRDQTRDRYRSGKFSASAEQSIPRSF